MSKKLKILYHHRVAAQDGQSVHIEELTKSFAKLGHELIFVGPSLRPEKFGKQNKLLAFVRRVLPQFAQELLELLYGYRAYQKLLAAYKEHNPDILYERYNLFLPAGRLLKKKTGIPYFLEVNAPLADERAEHSGLALVSLAKKIEAQTWNAADKLLPVSNVLADRIKETGAQASAIQVLHNGINHEDYENVTGEEIRQKYDLKDKTVLGFTGFLREWHRLDTVISLIAEYDKANSPHILVVGDGPAIPSCKELAENLGVSDRVHFAGFTERAAMPKYLATMDVALQPAATDYASPLKLFEYMRSNLAIVAPSQPNIREILTDQETALLFEADDFVAASSLIKKLADDPALRNQLGEAARNEIDKHHYTWLDNAKRITLLAEEILANR